REALGAPEAGHQAEFYFRLTELRFFRGVDEVARERELAPAAEGDALDRGDERAGCFLDEAAHGMAGGREGLRFGAGHRAHFRDVRSGDEGTVTGAAQDRDSRATAPRYMTDRFGELVENRAVQSVHRGSVDDDAGDAALLRTQEGRWL